MAKIKYANVMLLGRTGVGKSSFINYLTGSEVCKTGFGKPITQGFETYEYNDVDGVPLRIFDSKGLEALDYPNIKSNIIGYISKRCSKEKISEWIHTVFYCFNVQSGRVLPEEIALLKELKGSISQSIHIILTHCDNTDYGRQKYERMRKHIRSEFRDRKVHIYCVNSVRTENFHGVVEQFGREEILDGIFKQLWSDIAQKISVQYAAELYEGSNEYLDRLEHECEGIVQQIRPFKMIGAALRDEEDNYFAGLDNEMGNIESRLLDFQMKLNKKYNKRISELVDFCSAYGRTMTGDMINMFDAFDLMPKRFLDIAIDDLSENSRIGHLVHDIDNFENYDFWGQVGTVFKAVGSLFIARQLAREMIADAIRAARESIPDEDEIADSIYDKLMGAFNCEENMIAANRYCEKVDAGEEVSIEEGFQGLQHSIDGLLWMMKNVG